MRISGEEEKEKASACVRQWKEEEEESKVAAY